LKLQNFPSTPKLQAKILSTLPFATLLFS
jgi:hypothetical protein